jgi:hypothetical protein
MLFASIASIASALQPPNRDQRGTPLAEPLLLAVAGVAGVALQYPSVLRHPVLTPLRWLSVATATGILLALVVFLGLALGWRKGGQRGALLTVLAAGGTVLAVWRLSRPPAIPTAQEAGSKQTVLFGVDSLSQTDEVTHLREGVSRLGGIWYEKPVPPGLLTNSVWPAIVLDRPVSETGVFLVFQTPDWKGASYNLIRRASQKGCRTFALFSSRITFYLGKDAGFDVDRGGSRGWLHLATAFVKDGSVFFPVLLPHLRAIPLSISQVNQSGTFAYDVRREVHDILTIGDQEKKPAFVAAHLDYLHTTAYPPLSELTPAERSAVRAARVELIRDPGLDWQPSLVTGDPLSIEGWKLAFLEKVILGEIDRTRFLSAEKGNRMILFSDHGNRRRINDDNFGEPRYHRVLFATFGVAARDPTIPISLRDIPAMFGYVDSGRKNADPMVEYTNVTGPEWQELIGTAKLQGDGRVLLDPSIVKRAGARLKGFRPYTAGGYFPSPLRRDPPR